MSEYALIQEFIAAAQRSTELGDLANATEAVIRDFDFDYYAVLHHIDLQFPADGLVRLSNYPQGFVARMKANRYFADDPVLAASERAAKSFLWSDVPRLVNLTARQREIIAVGAREGLGGGYTVPIHVPGEFTGSCSFGVRGGVDIDAARLPFINYVGCFAFEAARRIVAAPRDRERRPLRLTSRQRDCLVLAGRGLPAREAARRLGIKQDTFEKHIGAAKENAGVQTTTQLIVRGLFDGHVTFHDLLERQIH